MPGSGFAHDPFGTGVVLTGLRHPLAAAASVTLADLASTALLATETGCAYRDLFEEQFDEPVSFLEFGTIEAIKRGVMAGLGVALLPSLALATTPLPAGVATRPPSAADYRTVHLVTAQGSAAVPAIGATIAAIRSLDAAAWGLETQN